ncbi:MAG: glycosyltransferase family 2 protein [Solirubrobacteraceae bacterium]
MVTVAVVSWNTRELLRACLGSLAADVDEGRARVVVVDNASSDGSAELVREEFPWAGLIASETNLGFGPAVNAVAAQADPSEWIAAANADIALEPGALAKLLAAGATDSGVGILAPRLIAPDGSTQHSVHPFPTLGLTLAFNLGVARLRGDRLALEGHWNPDSERRVDWALGAFLLIRRVAFDQLGGFEPEQWMYAEDLDLGWRAARAGWTTRYEPSARVRHVGAASTTQAWGESVQERWVRSTYGWMIRRRGPLVTRTYALLNTAGALARAAVERRDPQMRGWARLHARALITPSAEMRRER